MAVQFRSRLSAAARGFRSGRVQGSRRTDIPGITDEEIAEVKQFFPMGKFFIFGHARSGTTILARLVRQHQAVHCHWQAHFFTRPPLLESLVTDPTVGEWLKRPSNRWNRGRDLSPLILRVSADFILEREARRAGKGIVGDKSPNSLLDGEAVRLMHKVYPDAWLINIIRDGRDTVLSHRFQNFIELPEQLSAADLHIREEFVRDGAPFLRGEKSVFTERALRLGASGWSRNVEETDRMGRSLYGEHYLALRYEDLLARPWEQMEQIWSLLGAGPAVEEVRSGVQAELEQNLDVTWQNQKSGDIARNLPKGKPGTWQQMFTAHDRRVFREIAGETLEALGYAWD